MGYEWRRSVFGKHCESDLFYLYYSRAELPLQSVPLYVKNLVVRQSEPLTNATINAWFANMNANATSDAVR
jgi:hypothetical protein